ncbi:MAG: rhodanese-like domain-containing protein [Deltaproteobacteria bacterium]|nr:MAG: rhodanese-like domain-containing protein [Deltaproteobacteria bacterium]TMQ26512.1 MAG: rhodanese-like domain-containing protein [Deltaproteobacteria bacterium]
MQRRVFALLLAGLTGAAVLGCVKNSSAPVVAGELKPLTVDQVATRLAANDGKTFIYDNNPKESWVAGHVPGARWLDDEKVTASDLPADKNATLIFYCHNET